jgi:toxin ParE1/3/4
MGRYKLDTQVRDDLKRIYRYISRDKPSAAGHLRKTLFERFRLLASNPLIGEARDDLFPNVRMFPVGNYVILYRPMKGGIEVVQIVHSAQDIDALFQHDLK